MPTSSTGRRDRETRARTPAQHIRCPKEGVHGDKRTWFYWHAATQQFRSASVRVDKTFTLKLARQRSDSFPTKTSSLHLCMRQLICSIEFCYLSEMFYLDVLRMRSTYTVARSETTYFCSERFKWLLNTRESL